MVAEDKGRHRRSASTATTQGGFPEPATVPEVRTWTIEMWEDAQGHCPFVESVSKLDPYRQAILDACITHILRPMGPDVAATEWGKALGQGLYELRIRRSLQAIRTWGKSDPPPAASAEEKRPVLLRVLHRPR